MKAEWYEGHTAREISSKWVRAELGMEAEPKAWSLHCCDGGVQGFQRELEKAPSLLCAVNSHTSSLQILKPLLLLLPLLFLQTSVAAWHLPGCLPEPPFGCF